MGFTTRDWLKLTTEETFSVEHWDCRRKLEEALTKACPCWLACELERDAMKDQASYAPSLGLGLLSVDALS